MCGALLGQLPSRAGWLHAVATMWKTLRLRFTSVVSAATEQLTVTVKPDNEPPSELRFVGEVGQLLMPQAASALLRVEHLVRAPLHAGARGVVGTNAENVELAARLGHPGHRGDERAEQREHHQQKDGRDEAESALRYQGALFTWTCWKSRTSSPLRSTSSIKRITPVRAPLSV